MSTGSRKMEARNLLAVCSALVMLCGAVIGQTLPAGHPPMNGPALDAGALPPGHPPMGGAATLPALPPGHPSMDGAPMDAGALPSGHPPMGGAATLPSGHPPIESMTGGAAVKAVKGSITIHALPGAAGGAAITNTPIVVELYHQGVVLKKWDTTLDAAGLATISDINVVVPCQPMITLTYKGLLQQAVGPVIAPDAPDAKFDMKVFEGTDERPAFKVSMRHVIVRWAENGAGVLVTEMLSVENPAEKAWLGEEHEGGKFTFGLPLPANAVDVQPIDGFDEQTVHVHKEGVLNGSPLFPGQTQFRVNYAVPAVEGVVNLSFGAPADVAQMKVFVPAEGATVTAAGLISGPRIDMGEQHVRSFNGVDIKMGQSVSLAVSGLVATDTAKPASAKDFSPKNVAIAGVILIALCGVGVLFLKKPNPAKATVKSGDGPTRKNRKG